MQTAHRGQQTVTKLHPVQAVERFEVAPYSQSPRPPKVCFCLVHWNVFWAAVKRHDGNDAALKPTSLFLLRKERRGGSTICADLAAEMCTHQWRRESRRAEGLERTRSTWRQNSECTERE